MNRSWTSRLRGSPLVVVLIIIVGVVLLIAQASMWAIGTLTSAQSSGLRRSCSPTWEHPSHPRSTSRVFRYSSGRVRLHRQSARRSPISSAKRASAAHLGAADLVLTDVMTNDWFERCKSPTPGRSSS